MDFKNQNMFQNQNFYGKTQMNNPLLSKTVSDLKAMSMDPNKKNEVLSTLSRFQGQMNATDYNEILANVKSQNGKRILGEKEELKNKKEITDQNFQKTVMNLKNLEREMRGK